MARDREGESVRVILAVLEASAIILEDNVRSWILPEISWEISFGKLDESRGNNLRVSS